MVIPDHDNDGRTILDNAHGKIWIRILLTKVKILATLTNCTLGKFNYLEKDVDGELPEGDDTIPLDPLRDTTVQGKLLSTL